MPTGSPNAGYRTFNTGDVLTAAQVQYYLQNQSIMYFATAAARDTALTAGILQEGMFAYLADSNTIVFYDGSSWKNLFSSQTLTSPKETNVVSATAATGTVNVDVSTSSVLIYTTNASGNWTLNVRGNNTTTLDSIMSTGEQISVVFESPNGASAYYPTAFNIDGSAVVPKWLGGTAPSSGNANATDVYIYTIRKTGAATFTVLASQNKYA
jgi:hypothetical protein